MQDSLLARVGEAVWGWPMMALFLGTGIWYMLRLRGLPLRRLGQALRAIFRGGESADGISPYAALCTALAATIGTGNIVGVATALAAGGPGALLWMMVAALFGMATQYAEGYLAVRYRRRQGGKWLGGPFCYIEQGLGWRWLAVTFAVVGAAVGLLGVGTVAQVNSITTAVEGFFDPLKRSVAMTAGGNAVTWAAVIAGGLTVLFSAMVLLGGANRISCVLARRSADVRRVCPLLRAHPCALPGADPGGAASDRGLSIFSARCRRRSGRADNAAHPAHGDRPRRFYE